jgi:predicted nucleic acid-binding Zn ribbon protein
MAGHCHPEGVVDGILRVRTPGGAWAARLRENEKTIVEQLTELSGAQVTALHLVQGS